MEVLAESAPLPLPVDDHVEDDDEMSRTATRCRGRRRDVEDGDEIKGICSGEQRPADAATWNPPSADLHPVVTAQDR